MFTLLDRGARLCDGMDRRQWLQIGAAGLGGLSLAGLLSQRRAAAASGQTLPPRAKNVIAIFLLGGAPQHESWDPKPEAPPEIRGECQPIATRTPGLMIGDLMPLTAPLTDKIAVLRAMVTSDNAHSSSGYQMLTGVPHVPLNRENATPQAPNNWPVAGSIIRTLRRDVDGMPAAVTLPRHIANDGEIVWPGQTAGFLGPQFDPWLLHCDPSEAEFQPPALALPEEVSTARFDSRRSLLDQMNQHLDTLERAASVRRYSDDFEQAVSLMAGPKARKAFKIDEEPEALRDRYGRTQFGQSVLLARRLIESGVGLVQVNWPRVKDQTNNGTWDTHRQHAASLKSFLMPMMDQAYSALLEDLSQRGLLDDTLVLWLAEFGHTPKINGAAGRDHWGRVFSVALAGGGVRGGTVYGESDRHAAEPQSGRVEPRDLWATVYRCLGFDPHAMMRDQLGRPLPITTGRVIEPILA